MKDFIEIFEKILTKYKDVNINLIVIICLAVFISLKIFELIIPKIIEKFFDINRKFWSKRKNLARTEQAIRDLIERHLSTNLVAGIPSIENIHYIAPIEQIFVPVYVDIGDRKSIDAGEAIAANNNIVIYGQPGCGKSTLISMLAMAYAKDQTEVVFGFLESRLPLFLELKKLKNDLPAFPQAFSDYFFDIGLKVEPEFILEQLTIGRCVIFLDGLDECGDEFRRSIITRWMINSNSLYSLNRWIITTRSTSNNILKIPNFQKVEIKEFSINQIRKLLNNWFSIQKHIDLSKKHDELIDRIFESKEYQSIQPYLYNPLMITLIIVLYGNDYEIPKSRARILHLFIQIVAKEWDGIKFINTEQNDVRIDIISKLALLIMSCDKTSASIDLYNEETSILLNNIAGKYNIVSMENFLDFIVDRTGLMKKTVAGKYEFVNKNFLECLSALEIINSGTFNKYINFIYDEYWINTLEFCACFHRNTIDLINLIDKEYSYKNVQCCKILSNMYLGNEYIDDKLSLMDELYSKIEVSIYYLLEARLRDEQVLRMAYYILGENLLKRLIIEAKNFKTVMSPETISWAFISIDTDIAINYLLKLINDNSNLINFDTFFLSLGSSKNSISTKFLLESISGNDKSRVNLSIKTLISQGDVIVPYCKSIIEDISKTKQYRLRIIVAIFLLGYSRDLPYIIAELKKFSIDDQSLIVEFLKDNNLVLIF